MPDADRLPFVSAPGTVVVKVGTNVLADASGKPAVVEVEELGVLPQGVAAFHVSPDGAVFACGGSGDNLFALTDGKWAELKPQMLPAGVGPDGTLWAWSRDGDYDRVRGRVVLYKMGAKAERLVWTADELAVGFEKPAMGAVVLPLYDLGLACLQPAEPGAKPKLRARYVERREGGLGRLVATASGHLLLAGEYAVWAGEKKK